MTEQERLSMLVGNNDLEPIDSASILFNSLRDSIGDVSPEKLEETKREIEASGAQIEGKRAKKVVTTSITSNNDLGINRKLPDGYSTEKVLISLYDIRDILIDSFRLSGINSNVSKKLVSSIEKVDGLIKTAGGEIERFEPLNHCSGLQAPNFYKNAEKVIATTTQCYSLGKIEDAKISDNGKTINICFLGINEDVSWKAMGTINAEEWTGNEAIDYVYTPREGHMSVKAYDNGRWIDKISSGKYKVHWDLIEKRTKRDEQEKQTNIIEENINNDDEDIGAPLK
jgi:hypothetical protein